MDANLDRNPHVYGYTVGFHRREGNQGHFCYSKLYHGVSPIAIVLQRQSFNESQPSGLIGMLPADISESESALLERAAAIL